jgi:hypothetical protein
MLTVPVELLVVLVWLVTLVVQVVLTEVSKVVDAQL